MKKYFFILYSLLIITTTLASVIITPTKTLSLYVSTSGSNQYNGESWPEAFQTITHALEYARYVCPIKAFTNINNKFVQRECAVEINLANGVYELLEAIQLTPADSFTTFLGVTNDGINDNNNNNNNNRNTQSYPLKTTISGGVNIVQWQPIETTSNFIIWAASSTQVTKPQSRQLYLNGQRLTRTTATVENELNNVLNTTSLGYLVNSTKPLTWTNPDTVEMVYTSVGSGWTECRCTVDHVISVPCTIAQEWSRKCIIDNDVEFEQKQQTEYVHMPKRFKKLQKLDHVTQYNEECIQNTLTRLTDETFSEYDNSNNKNNNNDSNNTCTFIYMKQPCFYNALNKPFGQGVTTPRYLENINGLNYIEQQSNQWYYDVNKNVFIVSTTPDVDLNQGNVVTMPISEELIHVKGGSLTNDSVNNKSSSSSSSSSSESSADIYNHHVVNVKFANISFAYATWLQPSGNNGYVEMQSGALLVASNWSNSCDSWQALEGQVNIYHGYGVEFDQCEFAHFGKAGVYIGRGSQYTTISNSYFHDISGAAIQLGDYNTWNISDPTLQERYNTIFNNLIEYAAVEYHGNVGVSVGYSYGTVIDHNTIQHLSYGGVSIGWGWETHNETYAQFNNVTYNYIFDYKTLLTDGGGIYALGWQPSSYMTNNYVLKQTTSVGGALYPDENSAFWTIQDNVVAEMCQDCEWLHIWIDTIHNIFVDNNFSDTNVYVNHGTNCTMVNNTIVTAGQEWPLSALYIIAQAGVQY